MEQIGSATCQPVGNCGSGTYGAVATSAKTIFVDASYTGDANGSLKHPYPNVAAALKAASAGAHIAVAAGSYPEPLVIDKQVTIEGRCAELVLVKGGAVSPSAAVLVSADKVVLSGLTVGGAGQGVVVSGARLVQIERVIVAATKGQGISLIHGSQATLDHVLVDQAGGVGVEINAAGATASQVVVRGTTLSSGHSGIGVVVKGGKHAATLTMKDSVLTGSALTNLEVSAASATLERTVVRDAQKTALVTYGPGISLRDAASLSLMDSLVANNRDAGIRAFSSKVTVSGTIIRDTQPQAFGSYKGHGVGVLLYMDPKLGPAEALILDSLIQRNPGANVSLWGSKAKIVRSEIADSLPSASDQAHGVGIWVGLIQTSSSVLALEDSVVRGSYGAGISIGSSKATLTRSVIRDTVPEKHKTTWGVGILVSGGGSENSFFYPSTVTVTDCVLSKNSFAGIHTVDSSISLTRTHVSNTLLSPGYNTEARSIGVVVGSIGMAGAGKLTMLDCTVADNVEGLYLSDAAADVRRSVFRPGKRDSLRSVTSVRVLKPPADLTMNECVIDGGTYSGIEFFGVSGTITESVVRNCRKPNFKPLGPGLYEQVVAAGIIIGTYLGSKPRLLLSGSKIAANEILGVLAVGADVTLKGCSIGRTSSSAGAWGDGVLMLTEGRKGGVLEIWHSSLTFNARAGVNYIGGTGTIRGSLIRGNKIAGVLDKGASPTLAGDNVFEQNGDDRFIVMPSPNFTLPEPPPSPF